MSYLKKALCSVLLLAQLPLIAQSDATQEWLSGKDAGFIIRNIEDYRVAEEVDSLKLSTTFIYGSVGRALSAVAPDFEALSAEMKMLLIAQGKTDAATFRQEEQILIPELEKEGFEEWARMSGKMTLLFMAKQKGELLEAFVLFAFIGGEKLMLIDYEGLVDPQVVMQLISNEDSLFQQLELLDQLNFSID